MADSNADGNADSKDEPFDFDSIRIHVMIDDEIDTGSQYHQQVMVTPDLYESTQNQGIDIVRRYAQNALENILQRRDEDVNDEGQP